jgi:hypothetical protein
MANHSRWCHENPKRKDYVEALKSRDNVGLMNAAKLKSGSNNQFNKAKINGEEIPVHSLKGKKHPNPFQRHSTESIKKISEAALKSTHRRLRRNVIDYNGILLDSEWELELAKRLDFLNIKWSRPEPLKWIDINGTEHNYFPDFYLEEYDLYLDPKNPHAFNVQLDKINILNETYGNIIWIKTLEECKLFSIDKYK